MKRKHSPKRRDRRTGMSPYRRHAKREFLYSQGLRSWEASYTGKQRKDY
jgi:hypothetical protein